jgi:hypothetical protein
VETQLKARHSVGKGCLLNHNGIFWRIIFMAGLAELAELASLGWLSCSASWLGWLGWLLG